MSETNKNTIEIRAANRAIISGSEKMLQYLADNPNSHFNHSVEKDCDVYSHTSQASKHSVTAVDVIARISLRYNTRTSYTVGTSSSTALTPDNVAARLRDVLDAMEKVGGNANLWSLILAEDLIPADVKLDAELVTKLAKRLGMTDEKLSFEQRSAVLVRCTRDPSIVAETPEVGTNGAGIMKELACALYIQGPNGRFTLSCKPNVSVVQDRAIETIRTLKPDGTPETFTAHRAHLIDSAKKVSIRSRPTEPPVVYVRCEPNGSVPEEYARLVYYNELQLAEKKRKNESKSTVQGPIIATTEGIKKRTEHNKQSADSKATDKKYQEERYEITSTIVDKHVTGFWKSMNKLKDSEKMPYLQKTFDSLPSGIRAGLTFTNIKETDFVLLRTAAGI